MADILKYRKLDGTEVEVANNSTIALGHTEASIEFTVNLDQFDVLEGETRGWFALAPTSSVPQTSDVYGITISPNQGQTVSVTIQTVAAKSIDNLKNNVFTRFSDTFTVSVVRASAPADSTTDSVPINFLVYPDSDAALAIVNASFALTDSATTFGIVDSPYVQLRQNSDFDFLTNLPKTIDSVGITRALFDSDVRSSISVTDAGGDGSLIYNNSTGIITYTGPSPTEVRSHLSAGGDLSFNQATGQFSFSFDSDFNVGLDSAVLGGFGLKFTTSPNNLSIDSSELQSYYRQSIRTYFSGGTGVTYTAGSGVIAIGQPVATTDSVTFAGITVSGNLQVNGTTTTVNSTTLDVADKNITIAKGAANAAAADGGGITVDGANATLTYAATGDKFVFNKPFEGSFLGADSNFDARLATKTTTNLAEGNNLYYTTARADSDFDVSFALASTDSLSEGSTNLYYTVARADSAARSAMVVVDAGGDGSFTYDSASGKFTYTGPSASEVRSHFSAQGDLSYDSTTGIFQFDVEQVYTKSNFDSDFNVAIDSATTSDLSEGNNLYYTVARADSAARSALIAVNAGGDGSFSYDSATGKFTYTGPSATEVRAHFTGDKGLTYNSTNGNFDIDSANIRSMFSAGGDLSYNSGTGQFSFDVESVYTKANFDSDFNVAIDSATTSDLSEGSNLYYTTARVDSDFDASFALASTDSLSEGSTNLYYTNARADARVNLQTGANLDLSQKSTSDLSEGTNKYYTKARVDSDFDASFALASTDSLSEGSTNLYFTNERVDDRVGALITGGVNVTATYDDAAGTLEIKVPFENIDDRVGTILTAGSGINVNYDDPNATITIANIADSAYIASLPVSTFANDKNYLDSTYAAALIDSAHIKAVVDSAYVQLIQADLQRDSGFISSVITGGTLNMGANNIITTGKILFSNVYSTEGDLPNATTYHGMFAHVHATGAGYFAHGGNWIKLANNSQLANSSNWDTAFGWGNHASAGYQSAATALDSAMVYRFTIDSARTLQLVDSDVVLSKLYPNSFGRDSAVKLYYNDVKKFETTDSGAKITGDLTIQTTNATIRLGNLILQDSGGQLRIADSAGVTTTVIRNVLDSALITQLIDASYVQSRQTSYNTSDFTDSTFVTGLPISTFTNDANYLDSTTITGVVNNAYVRARQALIDSDLTKLLVDSAYIQLRDRFQDSSLVTSTVDSSYVQSRVPETYLSTIIDSDYVTARAGVVLDSASIASGVILTTVDAAYVQARQIQYNTSDFLDSTTVAGVIDSAYLLNTGFTVEKANQVYVDESEDDNTAYNIIFENTHPAGNGYSQMQVDDNGLQFNPATNELFVGGYIRAAAQNNPGQLSLNRSDTGVFDGNEIGRIRFAVQSEASGGDALAEAAAIVAEADATFTSSVNSTDMVFKLGTSGTATEKARLTHEGNFSATSFSGDGSALTGISAIDSALTIQLIDSAYIALRTTAGTDSATVINLIDSDYISNRVVAFANPIFTEFKYITDSAGQIVFEGNDANGNALSIETGNHSVFVNGIRLLPSDFTSDTTNNRITLDSAGAAADEIVISTIKGKNALAGIAIIDSDYISSRTIAVANPQFNNFRYIATSNQTAFTGADVNSKALNITPSNFQVFLNGIRLLDSDFTADTDNNTITLSSGATASDELVVTTVIGQTAVAGIAAVDSAYVQARVAAGTDSSTVISLINDTVTAAYISNHALDSAAALQILLDSSEIIDLIDSAYINARVSTVDSAQVLGIVDSDYIATAVPGVVAPTFSNFRYIADSGDTSFSGTDINGNTLYLRAGNHAVFLNGIKLQDSDFTSNVATNTITLASSLDSADDILIQTITGDIVTTGSAIDSNYIGARVGGVVRPTFTDFRYVADSGQTAFTGADLGGTSLDLRTDNFSVFLNGIKLIDSDFTSNVATNTITLTEAADSGDALIITTLNGDVVTTSTAIDSAYVQARQEGVNATFKDYKFVATANQTVFSGNDANGTALSFEANKFHVLLNGIRLDASDFTESADNNKITLATGAAVSDELIVSTIGTEKTTTLASITSTVDSAYVQARQVDLQRDSAFVTGIIDSAYIEPLLTPIHISSSKVGIGTTSPDDVLEIQGSTNNTSRQVKIVDGSDATATHIGQLNNISYFTNNTHYNGSAWVKDDNAVGSSFLGLDDGAVLFGANTTATPNERVRITSAGSVGIGTSSPRMPLTISGDNATSIGMGIDNASGSSTLDFVALGAGYNAHGAGPGEVWFYSPDHINIGGATGSTNNIKFLGGGVERMRLDASGRLLIGATTYDASNKGVYLNGASGKGFFTVSGDAPLAIHRLSSDGDLVELRQDNNTEGTISVSGATVSYNGFSGQHETSGIATNTAIGTVVSTIDELDTYFSGDKKGQTRADHAKVKVSDSAGDNCIYGVVSRFDSDGKAFVASVGIGSIRVTGACAKGDLLESNGDGTAKVQSDDIIRSKTIGKVTIGNSNSGVKLVSCVLYCG